MMRFLNTVCLAFLITVFTMQAAEPQREIRASWLTTGFNIDWPKTKITVVGNPAQVNQQKQELINILDKLSAANFNVVFLQIRPMADALYPSTLVPWSSYLTGTRGRHPEYDPLAFAIEEAHKRGMELHGWMNPFRYTSTAANHTTGDQLRQDNPGWFLDFGNNGKMLDPGVPAVRSYIAALTQEVVQNYPKIDGIVWDDYFYVASVTSGNQDAASYQAYNPQGLTRADWRRDNVNKTVEAVYQAIQNANPGIRFGISPRGIWSTSTAAANKYGVTLPSGINGADNYNDIYCDALAWLSQGTIDYISPQLYWPTVAGGGSAAQDYTVLAPWWQSIANKYSRHFYSSHSLYENWASNAELARQVNINRDANAVSPGSVYYNTTKLLGGFQTYLKSNFYQKKTLPPKVTWKSAATPAVTNVQKNGANLQWSCSQTDGTYAIFAVPNNLGNIALNDFTYLVKRVWTDTKSVPLSDLGNIANTHKFAVASVNRYADMSIPTYEGAQAANPSIAVSPTSLSFSTQVNVMQTKTITVTGTDLTQNITISITGANRSLFSVSPSSLSASGGTVTVGYKPTTSGSHTASLTISSNGATSKTVNLTGTAGSGQAVEDEDVVFTQRWNYSELSGNTIGWVTNGIQALNDMAYLNGKLYVVQRLIDGDKILIIDAFSGVKLGELNTADCTVGTYLLSSIGVMGGKIVACNLAATGTSPLVIYSWDDDNAAATTLINTTAHADVRAGDKMSISGDMNNGKIWFASNEIVYYFKMTNGSIAATPTIINLTKSGSPFMAGNSTVAGIYENADGSFWVAGKDSRPSRFNASGVWQEDLSASQVASIHGTAIDFFNYGNKRYAVAADYLNQSNSSLAEATTALLDISNGLSSGTRKAYYPTNGFGTTRNTSYRNTVLTAVDGNRAYMWALTPFQGIAHYEFVGSAGTGTTQINSNVDLKVFAAHGQLSVEGTDSIMQIDLFTITGQLVKTAYNTSTMDVSNLQGVYVVSLRDAQNNLHTQKLIIR